MKKILSLVLALVMLMSLATTAFAVGTGSHTGVVKGKYAGGTTTPDVVSVDISWGAMEFTYTEGGTNDWNSADHSYTDNGTSGWTASGNTVKVTNHSNVDVDVSFAFAAETGYSVTGTFDVTSDTLAAGVEGKYNEADSVTATLTLAGSLANTVTALTKIGNITVTVA